MNIERFIFNLIFNFRNPTNFMFSKTTHVKLLFKLDINFKIYYEAHI